MSRNRKRVIDIVQTLPEDKIIFVLTYLQGLEDGMTDIPNDETIEALEETQQQIDNGNVTAFTGNTDDFFDQILSNDDQN